MVPLPGIAMPSVPWISSSMRASSPESGGTGCTSPCCLLLGRSDTDEVLVVDFSYLGELVAKAGRRLVRAETG